MYYRLFGLVAVLTVAAAAGSSAFQNRSPATKAIDIVAERFSFTPSEITIEQGTVVEFRLHSDDTSHGFRLIGPGEINVEIPKRGRGEARVMFEATEVGRYNFECSYVCGAGHSFMRGTIRVIAPASSSKGEPS